MPPESTEDVVEERLALFGEDPDINDWFEAVLGVALITMGLHQLFNPGGLFTAAVMQWLAATVVGLGIMILGHGLKDMGVKQMRRSMVRLEVAGTGRTIDHGLIRDVLLHPNQYQNLLYEAYLAAYEDGILTEEEMQELSALQRVLQVPERTAARMATRAAIQSALADDHVSEAELDLIVGAARPLGLSEEELGRIVDALRDHHLDPVERDMLDDLLGQIPVEEGPYPNYDLNEEE